jgi:hypothetical protein
LLLCVIFGVTFFILLIDLTVLGIAANDVRFQSLHDALVGGDVFVNH